ncbi:GlsB/YeaQ/YmgE family stress response membrane protein [Falsirhodobacter sp. alg1]|uniref:GlsB/YeaQ/YmgE family stress response membrane protein n=1 Tax=Falsirhodobacter sp. alg1 TaxID=1472418 RepID=UPI0005F04A92|nr:GlsB/YeaQ/YmgE family stress response membrane protein [Falsirhodobacter sp. alg1]
MAGLGWIGAIIIGAIAGWIAEKLMKSDHGLLMNIILGILGAVLMNFLLVAIVGATAAGVFGQLLVGVIGACILIWLGRVLRSRS